MQSSQKERAMHAVALWVYEFSRFCAVWLLGKQRCLCLRFVRPPQRPPGPPLVQNPTNVNLSLHIMNHNSQPQTKACDSQTCVANFCRLQSPRSLLVTGASLLGDVSVLLALPHARPLLPWPEMDSKIGEKYADLLLDESSLYRVHRKVQDITRDSLLYLTRNCCGRA